MRKVKPPQDGPKKKLLDAAERIVSEKGFDLVSVRDVTGAVNANVAAVNYHFGSRERLLDLVIGKLLEPLCEDRLKALEAAQRQRAGKMASLEEILIAYTKPLKSTAEKLGMEDRYFLKLIGRIFLLATASHPEPLRKIRETVQTRFLAALARILPERPDGELSISWHLLDAGLSHSFIAVPAHLEPARIIANWVALSDQAFGGEKALRELKIDDAQGLLFEL